MQKIIFFVPRILSLCFVVFLSLFALDVFGEYEGFGVVIPLLIHLIPSLILLGISLLAWKNGLIGAIVFIGFSIFYILMTRLSEHWSAYLAISGSSAIIGILFFADWMKKRIS